MSQPNSPDSSFPSDPLPARGTAADDERERRATERLRLLAHAGELLAQSLDVGVTLDAIARICVEWFAQISVVRIVEGGRFAGDAVAGSSPAVEAAVREALDLYASSGDQALGPSGVDVARAPRSLRKAVASGRATLIRDVTDKTLRGFAVDDAQFESFRRLGLSAILVVPLIARGKTIGLMTLSQMHGKTFDSDDLVLAEDLGLRAALAVDNARLFERLTTAVAVRDEFLAIASHELNTPLTALRIQLDSLRLGKVPVERRAERIEAASRQVTRLARLVSDLLDASRMGTGGLRLQKVSFDLASLLEEVVSRLSEDARRSGSAIRVHTEGPCLGSWDRPRVA
ncbi:MAG: GAF domain-containing sensor histidine kinase, partial [Polyangiaceae bacterium]